MIKPGLPDNEEERLQILESLKLVYSPAEERFDRITRLARRVFDVPIALVSIVASDRQWFKSADGLDAAETPREISFCGHAILRDDALVVNDALLDPTFADNPLVTAEPHVRFYAGQPLRVRDQAIGTLCLIDHKPREFSAEDVDALQSLGAIVETECGTISVGEVQQHFLDEHEQAKRGSLIDEVTQSWNKRALELMLPREISLSIRNRDDFSYLTLQVQPDPYSIEDIAQADAEAIIKETSRRLRRALRPYDLVAHTDSSRFSIYAPACTSDVNELLIDRIRSRVKDVPYPSRDGTHHFDVSCGSVAVQADREVTPQKVMQFAGMALDDAIKSGQPHIRLVL